jgi:hypothetical protein
MDSVQHVCVSLVQLTHTASSHYINSVLSATWVLGCIPRVLWFSNQNHKRMMQALHPTAFRQQPCEQAHSHVQGAVQAWVD